MELWKKSDGQGDAADGEGAGGVAVAAPAGVRAARSGGEAVASGAPGAAAPAEAGAGAAKAPAVAGVVVTGGVRVVGGGERAVARVASSVAASPGAVGVRKATAPSRPSGEAAGVEIRPASALPSVVRSAGAAAAAGQGVVGAGAAPLAASAGAGLAPGVTAGAGAGAAPVAASMTSGAASGPAPVPAPGARIEVGASAAPPPSLPRGGTGPLLPPRVGTSVGVRHAGGDARPPESVSLSGALLPGAGGAIKAGDPFDLFGDDEGPILVVESLPPNETLFDRTPVPLQERTFTVRYDSAGVAGIVALLMLSVMFMLGRTSATSVAEAQAPPAKVASLQPAETHADAAPPADGAARQARETGFEAETETAGGPAGAGTGAANGSSSGAASAANGGAASGATGTSAGGFTWSSPGSTGASTGAGAGASGPETGAAGGRTGASSAAATSGPEFGIMAVGGIPRKNADAVAAFMGKHGFQARIVGSGNRCGVIVGSYADKKGPAIDADLEKVRALKYVDGQKPFAYAYAYPLKK